MNTFNSITTRRSIGIVKDEPVPKEMIEKILTAGASAPSHYRTEPWRFFVLTGDSRLRLGEVLAEIASSNPNSLSNPGRAKKMPLRAPVIIAVAAVHSDRKNVLIKEEYAAVCCAVQNMLLTAHDLGLGAIWRTGAAAYHPKVKDFFKLPQSSEMVAFLYIGYPENEAKDVKKNSYETYTVWMET
ncbi:nitroreductase [Fictibacillus aquaticus]|uniref:Putative NAD(P)H nitroreductase n=1 Tax=Fictibacillus aquaticus TaxID=2021314 RepID=A0A235FEK7_9BACL|nr:nitroreductase [Fictibacillus aquaticus]